MLAIKEMAIQSEAALEAGLIEALQKMNYEYVQIDEETNLKSNFKKQLEIHNKKALAEIGMKSVAHYLLRMREHLVVEMHYHDTAALRRHPQAIVGKLLHIAYRIT